MSLEIKIERENKACVVTPSGSLNSDTSGDLESALCSVLDGSVKVLRVNMAGVGYVSSLGMGVLIGAKKKIEKQGGVFMMTDLQPQVQKILDVVSALPGMNIFASREEADAYFDKIQKGEIGGER